MEILYGLLMVGCLAHTLALPTKSDEPAKDLKKERNSFASEASKLIATNLLKSNIDIDGNQVYSPLGITSILAVLAEASVGETYNEFSSALGFPQDRLLLRETFKSLLGKYHNSEYTADPSFQTWLYIYRNNSARQEFKDIMKENYYVDVKEINRLDYVWDEPSTSLDLDGLSATNSNSKDVVGFETLKRIKIDAADEHNDHADRLDSNATPLSDTYGEEIIGKEASKFDHDIDDKQYVEKPVILEEIKKEQELKASEAMREKLEKPAEEKLEKQPQATDDATKLTLSTKADDTSDMKKLDDNSAQEQENKSVNKRNEELGKTIEDNETVQNEEKLLKESPADKLVIPIQEVLDSNEPQKVSIPLQKLENAIEAAVKGDNGEIMLALESHIRAVRRTYGARSLFHKDDITTGLSANSLTGREMGSKAKMLLFNGLYYRSNWAKAFTNLQPDADEFFYMTADDAMKTPMMFSQGNYYTAELEHLNAKFLCLPYEDKRYGMLLLIPNELEGLRGVIEKFQPSDFKLARSKAEEKELKIKMPRFQIEETSRSETMLKSLGLRRIFSRAQADLSLLSEDNDMHVDEVVQFVSVRVDEGSGSAGAISASTGQLRNAQAEIETIEINRPFIYFIMDCEDEFIIASGKVYAPDMKEDATLAIEVDLEQA